MRRTADVHLERRNGHQEMGNIAKDNIGLDGVMILRNVQA